MQTLSLLRRPYGEQHLDTCAAFKQVRGTWLLLRALCSKPAAVTDVSRHLRWLPSSQSSSLCKGSTMRLTFPLTDLTHSNSSFSINLNYCFFNLTAAITTTVSSISTTLICSYYNYCIILDVPSYCELKIKKKKKAMSLKTAIHSVIQDICQIHY